MPDPYARRGVWYSADRHGGGASPKRISTRGVCSVLLPHRASHNRTPAIFREHSSLLSVIVLCVVRSGRRRAISCQETSNGHTTNRRPPEEDRPLDHLYRDSSLGDPRNVLRPVTAQAGGAGGGHVGALAGHRETRLDAGASAWPGNPGAVRDCADSGH